MLVSQVAIPSGHKVAPHLKKVRPPIGSARPVSVGMGKGRFADGIGKAGAFNRPVFEAGAHPVHGEGQFQIAQNLAHCHVGNGLAAFARKQQRVLTLPEQHDPFQYGNRAVIKRHTMVAACLHSIARY